MKYLLIALLSFTACPMITEGPSEEPTNETVQYSVGNNGASAYRFQGEGVSSTEDDPTITLIRGVTYEFLLNMSGTHPFFIKSAISSGSNDAYNTGVTNNGASSGSLLFEVPLDAPDQLFYQCSFHASMAGTFTIVDPVDSM